MFTRRKQNEAVPEVGAEAPEFNLPSAQGGQLRLSMRTVGGPGGGRASRAGAAAGAAGRAGAPGFSLPSARGGQLRLSMRTVRGPVVVAFYRPGDEEDVEYFKALAEKEQEINMASASVVGIGVAEPDAAREFARASDRQSVGVGK